MARAHQGFPDPTFRDGPIAAARPGAYVRSVIWTMLSTEDVRARATSNLVAPSRRPVSDAAVAPPAGGSWLHDGSDALGRERVEIPNN